MRLTEKQYRTALRLHGTGLTPEAAVAWAVVDEFDAAEADAEATREERIIREMEATDDAR